MISLNRISPRTFITTRFRIFLTITIVLSVFLFVSYHSPSLDISTRILNDKPKIFFKNDIRKETIRVSFKKAWSEFIITSQGSDEINSVTGEHKTTWGGWGVTLIDSLDTLYIMNLTEEFDAAAETLSHVDFTKGNITTLFFEVVIRNLGGLLSAYDLSGKKIFLDKAKALGDVLLKNFESPSGYPYREFNFRTQKPVVGRQISLANVGTCQLEFTRLSLLTGDPKYRNKALSIFDKVNKVRRQPGLYNLYLNTETGRFDSDAVSYGADADSFYEYLLKVPLLIGSKDTKHDGILKMFAESMDVMQKQFIKPCYNKKICLGKMFYPGNFVSKIHHLEMFIPGLLLLGGQYTRNETLTKQGIKLLDSFIEIPELSATGLVPEEINFYDNEPKSISDPKNSLRPELVESLFYAYRTTSNEKYRNITWSLFQSFEKYSRVEYGYSDYKDVTKTDAKNQVTGDMPSFFFAETFKYMYLNFCEDDILPLHDWVFNTEAHPLRRTK